MKATLESELSEVAHGLGEDELNVLLAIAHRLQLGQRQYGELVVLRDPRNFHKEASEEFLDASVYLAIEMLKRTHGAK